METVRQISVSLENKSGMLAKLCRCLADRLINITAISVVETTEQGVVRLVVDKPDEAMSALKECALGSSQTNVLLIELPNEVGALADMTEKLTQRNININFVYGSTICGQAHAFIVLGTADINAAREALPAG